MLRADSTISSFLGGARELPIKFKMVYVERGKRHESLQPRYDGPAIVLKNQGKVLTIKYLHRNGKTHTVNIERVKPVHKLRDEYADFNLPIPTCLLREATPIGDVEDDDAVDMYDDNDSIVIEVNNDAESTLTLSDARL